MLRALAGLALLLAACGGPSVTAPLDASTPREGHREWVVQASLTMTVTGDVEIGPETLDARFKVVEIHGGKNPKELWFYSISPAEPVRLADGRLMLFSADLSPGIYDGPGRYELSEEAGVVLSGKPGLGSGAYVQVYRTPGPGVSREEIMASFHRYDVFGKPCALDVEEDSVRGTVDCPELKDGEGERVAVRWTWART